MRENMFSILAIIGGGVIFTTVMAAHFTGDKAYLWFIPAYFVISLLLYLKWGD